MPFIMDGLVSLVGNANSQKCHKKTVRVLRDTGTAQSFILEVILPLSDESSIGSSVLVQGFVNVPLHKIEIESSLVAGRIVVVV